MQQSALTVAFDNPAKDPEHGAAGSATRTTAAKSSTPRGSYLANGSLRSLLYPNLIGVMLAGAGFDATTTGTPVKTHTFKISTRAAHSWLTIWSQIGGLNRRAVDARLTRLTIEADTDRIRYNGEFRALSHTTGDTAPASPTEEKNVEMLPTVGDLTITLWPDGTPLVITDAPTANVTRLTLDIANPLDEEDRSLFRAGRADLPQTGLDVTGAIEGIDLTLAQYQAILNGAAAATTPTSEAQIAEIEFTLQSAANIAGQAVPYSLHVTIAHAEINIDDFSAEGTDLIRWNLNYKMIDDTTAPIIIELANEIAAYN